MGNKTSSHQHRPRRAIEDVQPAVEKVRGPGPLTHEHRPRTKHRSRGAERDERRPRVEQNHAARELLQEHISDRMPTDDEIKLALAAQQSQSVGELKKPDLIAILVRLNPARNTALVSQFKRQDLIDFIRHELYNAPLQLFMEQQSSHAEADNLEIVNE